MSANPVGLALAAAGAAGLAAGGLALAAPHRARAQLVGAATAVAGVAGAVAGGMALTGRGFTAHAPNLLPLGGVYLHIDALSGAFLAVTGAVVAASAVYGIGYFRHEGSGRAVQAVWPLFALALLLVPTAASVSTLLYAWELMAVTSLVLVCSGHGEQVRSAGLWYAVMTHLGFACVLAGLAWLAAAAHGETYTAIAAASSGVSPAVRGGVFVLCLIGFGSKAGMVPLHAWLPRAHPEAPSPVSAAMSAAMVNLGIYGVIRVGFDLLHGGSRWWWLAALLLGALSAVYGIIQAAVESDLKRLLAYSTVENLGLILLAGVAGPALTRAVEAAGLDTGLDGTQLAGRLSALGSTLSPLLVVGAVVAFALVLKAGLRAAARGPRREAALWDCGAPPLTARMEYTATSFAEPLQRVFDDVLAPESDLDVTPHDESEYLVAAVAYRRAVPDRIEHRLYLPVVHSVRRLGGAARYVANGSVHRYLGYGFSAVVVLLVVLAGAR